MIAEDDDIFPLIRFGPFLFPRFLFDLESEDLEMEFVDAPPDAPPPFGELFPLVVPSPLGFSARARSRSSISFSCLVGRC